MTANEIIQITASLATLVGVIATAILGVINGIKSDRNAAKSDDIKQHVNSMATARETKIDTLEVKVNTLLETIATMTEDKAKKEKIAALIAQKQAGEVTVAVIEEEPFKKT